MSDMFDLHPARANKPEGFLFKTADALRVNSTWARFLDVLHPTAEHVFFRHAAMGAFAHEIENLTKFEVQYILQNYGETLKTAFGRSVHLKANRRAA